MQINSYAAFEPGGKLQPYTFTPSDFEPDDIEIKVSHCGICHSDIHMIDNDWDISAYPLIPGHEIVGVITDGGNNVEPSVFGRRVGVGWQSNSCHECEWCVSGQENLCSQQEGTVVGRPGGFADYIRIDRRFAFPIPDNLEPENAAPLLCGGLTVYSPLKIYSVDSSAKTGVIGIGGLGHLAVQFAHACGCEVTAFSTSPEKEDETRKLGAHRFVDARDLNRLEKLKGTFDYLVSTVTAPLDWTLFTGLLRPNGRLNFVGGTVGSLDIPAGLLVVNQISVSGSKIGSRTMMSGMLNFAARHHISALTEEFPLNDVNEAVEHLRANNARFRVVLKN